MPTVHFTANLQRHVGCPEQRVEASNVAEALEKIFTDTPLLRSYILDDQGALHRHMAIMVNGTSIKDRRQLNVPIAPDDEIYVLQALSGG